MPGEHGRPIDVTIVVSGEPHSTAFPLNQRLEQVVRRILNESGNTGQDPSSWELRDANGMLLDLSLTVSEAGLIEGATLFLTPRAGAGG
jgi:hypothetical protein